MMGDSLDPITGGDSLSSANDQTTVVQVSAVEVGALVNFIKKVVSPILEGDWFVQSSLEYCLNEIHNQERLRRFITDPQNKSLLVQRISAKGKIGKTIFLLHMTHTWIVFLFCVVFFSVEDEEVSDNGGHSDETVAYTISDEVVFSNMKINRVLLIKISSYLEADKSIHSQLDIIKLRDANPYETLHSYISTAIAPFFKAYVRETRRAER